MSLALAFGSWLQAAAEPSLALPPQDTLVPHAEGKGWSSHCWTTRPGDLASSASPHRQLVPQTGPVLAAPMATQCQVPTWDLPGAIGAH